MSLQILSSTPDTNAIGVTIDSKIELGFNFPVDPFTIPYGISVYSIGPSTMTGPLMAELDVNGSDINSPFDNITTIDYSYEVSGTNVILTPNEPLKGETKYYLQVVPGNDTSRFLSTATFGTIVYSKALSGSTGEINITSSYTGTAAATYLLSITASGSFDLSKNGVYVDSYDFISGQELLVDKKIKLSINGTFSINDTAEFHVFPASGVSSIYKISFLTSSYETAVIKSTRIEDKLYKNIINDLKVMSIVPAPLSVNNERCNPIIVRFNRDLDQLQDLTDQIKVHKIDLETGAAKKVTTYYQIQGSILKIYLVSVEPTSEISDKFIYNTSGNSGNTQTLFNHNSDASNNILSMQNSTFGIA